MNMYDTRFLGHAAFVTLSRMNKRDTYSKTRTVRSQKLRA